MPLKSAWGQQQRSYRVGIIVQGGPYFAAIDGLRSGLKEAGLEEGKQVLFHVRDLKSDLKQAEAAARGLEQEKVDVIYSIGSSVTVLAKRATTSVPIVFYAGTDPVATGLITSFGKPGGRLTGVHGRYNDLIAKRLELLTQLAPAMRRPVAFYNPGSPIAVRSMKDARDAAHRLRIDLVERQASSAEELRAGMRALKPGEADGFFQVTDGFIIRQAQLIIDVATEKKWPTIFSARENVVRGALAGYGFSYFSAGRQSANYVQRILRGADPGDLPVEQIDSFRFVINLKTAKSIGVKIPASLLALADEIIN